MNKHLSHIVWVCCRHHILNVNDSVVFLLLPSRLVTGIVKRSGGSVLKRKLHQRWINLFNIFELIYRSPVPILPHICYPAPTIPSLLHEHGFNTLALPVLCSIHTQPNKKNDFNQLFSSFRIDSQGNVNAVWIVLFCSLQACGLLALSGIWKFLF